MRILAVAHFKPQMHYGIMQKLVHGFIRLGHTVQLFDDRYTARRATWFHSRKWGILPMNRLLVEACKAFKPDLILLGHCEMVWNSTLEEIRHFLPETRLVYRNVDWLQAAQNVADIKRRTDIVDWIFSTSAGDILQQFAGNRARISHIPNCVDKAIDCGQAFAHTNQPHDIFYAIGGVYKGDKRPDFIQKLKENCPNATFDIRGMMGKPYTAGQEYLNALQQARLGLNYSRENNIYLYSSDRMAQYMGNGLLTLQDRASKFTDIFQEDEMAFYSDFKELCEKINFFLQNDTARQHHAKAGWQKIHAIFSSELVAQYILDRAWDKPLSHSYHWPTTVYM